MVRVLFIVASPLQRATKKLELKSFFIRNDLTKERSRTVKVFASLLTFFFTSHTQGIKICQPLRLQLRFTKEYTKDFNQITSNYP
jgi:hypothetical protein